MRVPLGLLLGLTQRINLSDISLITLLSFLVLVCDGTTLCHYGDAPCRQSR